MTIMMLIICININIRIKLVLNTFGVTSFIWLLGICAYPNPSLTSNFSTSSRPFERGSFNSVNLVVPIGILLLYNVLGVEVGVSHNAKIMSKMSLLSSDVEVVAIVVGDCVDFSVVLLSCSFLCWINFSFLCRISYIYIFLNVFSGCFN